MRFRRIRHGIVDSTSERAFEALAGGEAADGDVHTALGQTAGRGRYGRTWHSPPGEGLYLSIVLMPPPPAWPAPVPTMAGGLAVLDAVRIAGVRGARLKWPNDVLVGASKLAGILVETRGLDPEKPHCVIGIGVNVRQRRFPGELVREQDATSLALQRKDVGVGFVENLVLESLGRRLDQAAGDRERLEQEFLAATALRGRTVRVDAPVGERVGVLSGLTVGEGLELTMPDGTHERLALELVRSIAPVEGGRL